MGWFNHQLASLPKSSNLLRRCEFGPLYFSLTLGGVKGGPLAPIQEQSPGFHHIFPGSRIVPQVLKELGIEDPLLNVAQELEKAEIYSTKGCFLNVNVLFFWQKDMRSMGLACLLLIYHKYQPCMYPTWILLERNEVYYKLETQRDFCVVSPIFFSMCFVSPLFSHLKK